MGNMPTPHSIYLVCSLRASESKGEDIVYTPRNRGISFEWLTIMILSLSNVRDERTGLNVPLVYRLWHLLNRRVAMYGRDKR